MSFNVRPRNLELQQSACCRSPLYPCSPGGGWNLVLGFCFLLPTLVPFHCLHSPITRSHSPFPLTPSKEEYKMSSSFILYRQNNFVENKFMLMLNETVASSPPPPPQQNQLCVVSYSHVLRSFLNYNHVDLGENKCIGHQT